MTTIKISDTSKITITSFKTDNGALFLNIRKFYKTKNSKEWLPTKQGITIPQENVPEVFKGAKKEYNEIEENAVELKPRGKSDKKDKEPVKKKSKRNDD